jgi:hypothetical protein
LLGYHREERRPLQGVRGGVIIGGDTPMNRLRVRVPVSVLLFTAIGLSFPAQAPVLPSKYRTWLEEEVVYIITPTERQVFRDLSSDRDRDFFIEAFWRHRDPTPETEKN